MPAMLRASFAALVLAGVPTAGWAAPATPEEAGRLAALFERYVGHPKDQPGAVAVIPEGEAYKVTLDVARLLGFAGAANVMIAASALTAVLTPQADGKWGVKVDGLPGLAARQGDQSLTLALNGYKLDGLFDPRLMAFASAATQGAGLSASASGPKGLSTVTATGTSTGASTATDAGDGTADIKSTQTGKDIAYDVVVAPVGEGGAAAAPQKVSLRAASLAIAVTLGHMRTAALADLWAFLVAHASKPELTAHQDELKARLKAVLPLAASGGGEITATNLLVDTSLGRFGAASLSEHGSPDPAGQGLASELKVDGLSLPAGLVPAWAGPLTPIAFDISQSISSPDLTPALSTLIDAIDLTADQPLGEAPIATFQESLAARETALHMPRSTVATALMTLTVEGDLRLAKPLPTGAATVGVTGLDKTIDAVRAAAADDPQAASAVALLSAVKVLAKAQGADSYSWRIEAPPGQAVTVNGAPLNAGAPDAPPPAAPVKPKRKKPAAP